MTSFRDTDHHLLQTSVALAAELQAEIVFIEWVGTGRLDDMREVGLESVFNALDGIIDEAGITDFEQRTRLVVMAGRAFNLRWAAMAAHAPGGG